MDEVDTNLVDTLRAVEELKRSEKRGGNVCDKGLHVCDCPHFRCKHGAWSDKSGPRVPRFERDREVGVLAGVCEYNR